MAAVTAVAVEAAFTAEVVVASTEAAASEAADFMAVAATAVDSGADRMAVIPEAEVIPEAQVLSADAVVTERCAERARWDPPPAHREAGLLMDATACGITLLAFIHFDRAVVPGYALVWEEEQPAQQGWQDPQPLA